MKQVKRLAACILALLLTLCMLTACGGSTDWQDSKTMADLTKRGISADNVSLTAKFTVNGESEETYVSYAAKGSKEYVTYYEWGEDGNPTPLLLICKYDSTYYAGAYNCGDANDNGAAAKKKPNIWWEKGSPIEIEEFEYAKKLCKIPAAAEKASGYVCKRTEFNGQTVYTEQVAFDGMTYTYGLDQKETLLGLQTQINGETYTVEFTELKTGPADKDFPVPEVKS